MDPALTRPAPPAPVVESQRIRSLDVLRGVAVLGILVMNVVSFGMVSAAYMNPHALGRIEGANWSAWLVSHVLADMKMMGIFSMLFGAGIVLMAERLEASGGRPAAVHYRRMAWLGLFGLVHAYGLWYGDILYTYAVCGLVAYPLRRLPAWVLLSLGLVALAICCGLGLLSGLSMDHWPPAEIEAFRGDWTPTAEQVAAEASIYRDGWLAQMEHRVPTALEFQTFLFLLFLGWRAGGMVLLGMALYKWGVLSGTRRLAFYAGLVAVAALVGVPVILYGVHFNATRDWPLDTFFTGVYFNYWASILVSLGWVGLVCLWLKGRGMDAVARVLAATGRMAFTNYIMQSVICTAVFYGHGFGLYGRLERWELLLVVAGVWAAQLTWSPLWLRRFRYGPLEWLWRSLTYWRLQPMRRGQGRLEA